MEQPPSSPITKNQRKKLERLQEERVRLGLEQAADLTLPIATNLLPDELLLLCVDRLDGIQLSMCRRVCRRWCLLFSDRKLWRHLFERDFQALSLNPTHAVMIAFDADSTNYHGQYALYSWNWEQFLRADKSHQTRDLFRAHDFLCARIMDRTMRAYRRTLEIQTIALDVCDRLLEKWKQTNPVQYPSVEENAKSILLRFWKLPYAPAYAIRRLVLRLRDRQGLPHFNNYDPGWRFASGGIVVYQNEL